MAILIGNVYLMFLVVALIGSQAALFGPAKLGSIPEMLRPSKISSANGLLGLTTVVAVALGTGIGNWLSSVKSPGSSAKSGGGFRRSCWSAWPRPAGSRAC